LVTAEFGQGGVPVTEKTHIRLYDFVLCSLPIDWDGM